jgi:hypothetical protein
MVIMAGDVAPDGRDHSCKSRAGQGKLQPDHVNVVPGLQPRYDGSAKVSP